MAALRSGRFIVGGAEHHRRPGPPWSEGFFFEEFLSVTFLDTTCTIFEYIVATIITYVFNGTFIGASK